MATGNGETGVVELGTRDVEHDARKSIQDLCPLIDRNIREKLGRIEKSSHGTDSDGLVTDRARSTGVVLSATTERHCLHLLRLVARKGIGS